jgi:Fe-S cluster assembly protein SufD
MNTANTIKTETEPYLAAFRRALPAAAGGGEIMERRERALARFAELGFPTRRVEAWRFTDLRPLQRTVFPPAVADKASPPGPVDPASLDAYALGGVDTYRIVLLNGRFVPGLSCSDMPPGAWIGPTAAALARHPDLLSRIDEGEGGGADGAFAALNTAFFTNGFAVLVEDGVALDRPVEVIHLGRTDAPQSFHTRHLVRLGAGSRATLVETYAGDGQYWTNTVSSIELGAGASLLHARIQDEGRDAIHIGAARVAIASNARYDSFALLLGAALSRYDVFASITGEHAYCGVNGAFLLRGSQDATFATLVDHAAPCGQTNEVVKGVVDDRAHGVFQGKIAVRQQAQKTDAHQLNRNLLLSTRAAVDTKPELEIYADDVKCSHGATVGDLDETHLFYLRARGIDEAAARRMLIEAFAADAIDLVEDEAVRNGLRRRLDRWFDAAEHE